MNAIPSALRLKALIVDDEPLARDGLRMLLDGECEVDRVLEANNGKQAVELIRAERPDIVFLDVQMPEMDGFEVLRALSRDAMPEIIFVTAYDQYAIKAFEINAIDYLLKPVTRERFEESLRRLRARMQGGHDESGQMLSLLRTLAAPNSYLNRLAVRSAGKTYFVDVQDIDWIQAAENYVQLHTGTAKHLLHVPIQTLQSSLDPAVFLRVHRSLIVNMLKVKEIEPAGHGECVLMLESGARLQSSRTYNEAIKRWTNNPF